MPNNNDIQIAERNSGREGELNGQQPSIITFGAVVLSEEEDILPKTPSSARMSVRRTLADALNVVTWSLRDNASFKNSLRAVKV